MVCGVREARIAAEEKPQEPAVIVMQPPPLTADASVRGAIMLVRAEPVAAR